jgi:hypothetical protein
MATCSCHRSRAFVYNGRYVSCMTSKQLYTRSPSARCLTDKVDGVFSTRAFSTISVFTYVHKTHSYV